MINELQWPQLIGGSSPLVFVVVGVVFRRCVASPPPPPTPTRKPTLARERLSGGRNRAPPRKEKKSDVLLSSLWSAERTIAQGSNFGRREKLRAEKSDSCICHSRPNWSPLSAECSKSSAKSSKSALGGERKKNYLLIFRPQIPAGEFLSRAPSSAEKLAPSLLVFPRSALDRRHHIRRLRDVSIGDSLSLTRGAARHRSGPLSQIIRGRIVPLGEYFPQVNIASAVRCPLSAAPSPSQLD